MPKAKEKMVPISVTAMFSVTFTHKITEEQLKALEDETRCIEEVVDESVPYALLSGDGDCEMEWDYASPPAKPLKAPKKAKKK